MGRHLAAAFLCLWAQSLSLLACASAAREPDTAREVVNRQSAAEATSVAAPSPPKSTTSLAAIFAADEALAAFLPQAETLRFQVLVGVPSEVGGRATLTTYGFRVDAEYFYPASAIKLCAATMALEKLAVLRLEHPGVALDTTTPLRIHDSVSKRIDDKDPTDLRRGEISLGQEIRKALIVSDNLAFSRLQDFVGHDEINERLSMLGFSSARIRHRLLTVPIDARESPRMELVPIGSKPVNIPALRGTRVFAPPDVPGLLVGEAYLDESGRRVAEPMSFVERNRVSVRDLQELLVRIVRPELSTGEALQMDQRDRTVLIDALSTLPSESKSPLFDNSRASDEAQKPLLAPLSAALPRDRIKIVGKAGRAYGFLVENAYLVDETSNRSVFVTAVVYANSNQTMNDDHYDYDRVGLPLLASVAKLVAKRWLAAAQ